MQIYTVVRRLAKEQGKTVYRLEHDLQIGNGTIGRWNESIPRADVLRRVADYLGTTVPFLLDEAKEESK